MEETNYDHPKSLELEFNKEAESMTVFLWILSSWYAQRDNAITQVLCVTLYKECYPSTLKKDLGYTSIIFWSPSCIPFVCVAYEVQIMLTISTRV